MRVVTKEQIAKALRLMRRRELVDYAVTWIEKNRTI